MRHFSDESRAHRYERYRPRVHERFLAEAAQARDFHQVERALDVCCGTGHSTTALRILAHRVFGCDVSLPMLAASARDLRGTLVCCAAERLPFPDDAMDLISVSGEVDAWLDQELSDFFPTAGPGSFAYEGRLEVAVAS